MGRDRDAFFSVSLNGKDLLLGYVFGITALTTI